MSVDKILIVESDATETHGVKIWKCERAEERKEWRQGGV